MSTFHRTRHILPAVTSMTAAAVLLAVSLPASAQFITSNRTLAGGNPLNGKGARTVVSGGLLQSIMSNATVIVASCTLEVSGGRLVSSNNSATIYGTTHSITTITGCTVQASVLRWAMRVFSPWAPTIIISLAPDCG